MTRRANTPHRTHTGEFTLRADCCLPCNLVAIFRHHALRLRGSGAIKCRLMRALVLTRGIQPPGVTEPINPFPPELTIHRILTGFATPDIFPKYEQSCVSVRIEARHDECD